MMIVKGVYDMHKIDINPSWLFRKEKVEIKDINKESFENIDIPHTWNNIDGQDGGNDYHRGIGTYVKYFDYKKTSKRLYIEFEGVNSISHVYLNHQLLGEHQGGYSTFRYDITDIVKDKHNELIVYADNTHNEAVYPLAADFTFYGGIYRSVHLIETDHVLFDLMHHGAPGVYVTQKEVTKDFAHLAIDAYIVNHHDQSYPLVMDVVVTDKDHKVITTIQKEVSVNNKEHVQVELDIKNPHLWQGTFDPYLYTVTVKLWHQGKVVDQRDIKTGLRFFHMDHEAFYLNGIKTKLNGVSRHQDRKDIGNALTDAMHEEDMKLIHEMGANSIRLAHYQQADKIYDLCDELGFVVWAEIPYISMSSKTDTIGSNALSQMEELIKQNYNHSSIIMWGISNEITIAGKKNNVDDILIKLNTLTKTLDPYRLTTMAHVSMLPLDDMQVNLPDVIGYNHYFGWYSGKVEDFKPWLDNYRKVNPNRPLCLSEYGVEGIHTYHTETPEVKDYSEEYHALWHEKAYDILFNTPFVWGTYVWNMFAFAADFRDEGGSKGMNNKGLVTFDRKIKKDAFYYYQAKWQTKPVLHVCSKRFVDRIQDDITIKAYSNLNNVTFYLNGEKVEDINTYDVIHQAKVTLKPGENQIVVKADGLTDSMVVRRVDEKNKTYEMPEEEKNKGVFNLNIPGNWFDGISEEEQPLVVDDACLSVKDKIVDIMNHPVGKKLLEGLMADLLKHPFFSMMENMTIEQLREMGKQSFPYGAYLKVNDMLQKIKK
jgi:beta-galactosidase